MKKLFSIMLLLAISATSFCQPTTTSAPTVKSDYLKKSKNQKSGAWVLLAGGSVMVVTGILLSNQASFDELGATAGLAVAGGVAVLGSIPLFLASGRNKRKGMDVNASLKMERAPVFQGYTIVHTSYPALSVKITLR